MAANLPPPTGDAKNPPTEPVGWGKLFNWFYLLWKSVTGMTFGADASSYSSAIMALGGQGDTGVQQMIGPSAYFFSNAQTAQAIAGTVPTQLTNLTGVLSAGVSANTTTGTITITIPGVYYAACTVSYAAQTNWAVSALSSIIFKNGSNVSDAFLRCNNFTANTGMQTMTAVWVGYLNSGDTIGFGTFQNFNTTPSTINTEGSHTPCVLVRIAP